MKKNELLFKNIHHRKELISLSSDNPVPKASERKTKTYWGFTIGCDLFCHTNSFIQFLSPSQHRMPHHETKERLN